MHLRLEAKGYSSNAAASYVQSCGLFNNHPANVKDFVFKWENTGQKNPVYWHIYKVNFYESFLVKTDH